MPKTPVNYSDTLIYKLVCRDLTITELYVGSTTNFRQRKAQHKSDCCNEKSKKYDLRVYTFIRGNGGWENWDMILIHRQSCIDAHEAHTVERGYVESLGAVLNCKVPGRTEQENQAAYREAHRDQAASYREANRDQAAAYREANRGNQAAYREAHKDAKNTYNKQYREKQKLLKQQQPLEENI